MASGFYDISVQQNATFSFHLTYLTDDRVPVDLSPYTPRFQVRPHPLSDTLYLNISVSGVTAGGTGGTGGIYLNSGETGGGATGGMRILADSTSMSRLPVGTWHYSLDTTAGVTTEELLSGRFIVMPKVTK